MSEPFSESIGMRLRAAYLTMHRHFQRVFASVDLTADQFVLMKLLAELGAAAQKELVALACSDPNTIAAMVRRLEARKLLRRQIDPTDRRAWRVTLTKAGRTMLAKLDALGAGSHSRLTTTLPTGDAAVVRAWLMSVASELAVDRGPPEAE